MINFATTNAFRLMRRLATGEGSTAMYLLVHGDSERVAIEADLQAEAEVQLGARLPIGLASDFFVESGALGPHSRDPIQFLRIDRSSSKLVGLLDTHVIRLERNSAQFVFLTTDRVSEQLLAAAPNFRSRLTEILRILPDTPEEVHGIES